LLGAGLIPQERPRERSARLGRHLVPVVADLTERRRPLVGPAARLPQPETEEEVEEAMRVADPAARHGISGRDLRARRIHPLAEGACFVAHAEQTEQGEEEADRLEIGLDGAGIRGSPEEQLAELQQVALSPEGGVADDEPADQLAPAVAPRRQRPEE